MTEDQRKLVEDILEQIAITLGDSLRIVSFRFTTPELVLIPSLSKLFRKKTFDLSAKHSELL